jgi:hypothetical protein
MLQSHMPKYLEERGSEQNKWVGKPKFKLKKVQYCTITIAHVLWDIFSCFYLLLYNRTSSYPNVDKYCIVIGIKDVQTDTNLDCHSKTQNHFLARQ